jgi:cytosolic 5'-nucleotidase 3
MQDKNIIITNEEKLEAIKKKIIADGPEKLQVVSDFDKTLTQSFVNGQKIVSFTSVLRDENFLTPEYSKKAHKLFNIYQPLEMDINIPLDEKKKLMHEWWSKHYALMIKYKLSVNDLRKVAKSKRLLLRKGVFGLFDFLYSHHMPLIILSASGIGKEAITFYFENHYKLQKNILLVSNEFIWDDNGIMIGYKEPIIHSFDKDYSSVKKFSFYENLKHRKNIILLGDIINDVHMAYGFAYDNIIKIGFLNENEKGQLDKFKKAFDVIILNDGPMDYVNILLKELVVIN